jgi:IS5 family transposase
VVDLVRVWAGPRCDAGKEAGTMKKIIRNKQVGQAGFADVMTAELGGTRTAAMLGQLAAAIDWARLARPIEQAAYLKDAREPGRSHWPVELMIKALMLARWFNLSDPQLEQSLADRLSFRRFVGLSLGDATPDETTFVRFRDLLREHDLERKLFDGVLEQLQERRLIVKQGTLVDATILSAPAPRNPRPTPGGKKDEQGKSVQVGGDPEAGYTLKRGQIHYGYKAHIATDRRGTVTDFVVDTASVHDIQHLETLTKKEKTAVFADSAYMDQARTAKLRERGVFAGIIRRRVRGQKVLGALGKAFNRYCASVRAVVERPFAWMKNKGHRRTRYRGLRRTTTDVGLTLLAHNIAAAVCLRPVKQEDWALPPFLAAR